MSRKTEYVVDADGIYWLPPHDSRMMGWARSAWFKKKTGIDGRTASKESWQSLKERYGTRVLVEEETK